MIILSTISLLVATPGVTTPDVEESAWSERCARAIDYSEERSGTALLVLSAGRPICATAQPDIPQELWSGTKGIVALLAAIAVDDGLLSLDEPAAATLSEWQGDPVRSVITLRQLLTMTAGIPSQVGAPPSYAEAVAIAQADKPGTAFRYGPAPYQIFGEVLRRKLAADAEPITIADYAERRLFGPLGITAKRWRRGSDGELLMPQGIALTASDWAKIGTLINQQGRFGDETVIQPASLLALFEGSAANPAYAVGWWRPNATPSSDPITASFDLPSHAETVPADLVAAAGAGGQRLYAIPSLQLVIVRQARLDIAALRDRQPTDGPNRWSDAALLQILLPSGRTDRSVPNAGM
jgi:CubicO group peptidase (beta-lactamase class C family)